MTAPEDDPQHQQQQGQSNGEVRSEADLAQAYKEIMRGEQAATAMENNLSNLESKLDAILAAFDAADVEKATGENKQSSDGARAGIADKKEDEQPSGSSKETKAE
ncbi:uncharacterized protein F5Z01DRAFT_441398 [Emericellopsis atlantica]|uniref:Uncharacterized protein n=1 Tax=Emericellopsis atlantica TaxID=2614577 RepID=A0A9P8CTK8_9HYPO|nr:uncharacterized protein F5Z01DRAFT_441398 [Emericellopsis atlantica]KAG9256936.1 hypothetical protein F5Z01DRAFT_441398 [Emericellopsis atlantica]